MPVPRPHRRTRTPAPPTSFHRVQDTLNRTPSQSLKFDAKVPVPAATFRVTVTEHAFVVPIMESLRKEFELTPLQRQSAAWSSQCCGLNLAALTESIEKIISPLGRTPNPRPRLARTR